MNVLAHEILVTPRWRLGVWAARAWRRMGWRHVLLALLLNVVHEVFGPLGGIFFLPIDPPGWDPVVQFLRGSWVAGSICLVYGVQVADEAFDDGVSALRAYGLAIITLAALVPVLNWHLSRLMGGLREGAPQMLWWALAYLYQGGLGISIYAYWRVTQRTLRRAQAAETERARSEQRGHTARLLALQSRVEPQMLFDTLTRIADLLPGNPQAADTLLADLIVLLRAMLPGARADNSTVGREFALVDAWLRVTPDASWGIAHVHLQIAADAEAVGVAPMLVLPLVQTVLAQPLAVGHEWSLTARLADDRLLVTLSADPDGTARSAGLLAGADLSSLRERLGQLFGRSAHLNVSISPPTLTLDMPRLREDSDGSALNGEPVPAGGAADLPVHAA